MQPFAQVLRGDFRVRCPDIMSLVAEIRKGSKYPHTVMISDPPYSDRCHTGHNSGASSAGGGRQELDYQPWGESEVQDFVSLWRNAISGWWVIQTCTDLAPIWRKTFEDSGLYSFAPLPAIVTGSRVRLCGDGPSCVAIQVVVARPRTVEFSRWGTLPGYYKCKAERGRRRIGGKPLRLMRALVRDYSSVGDIVIDPMAGAGTTIIAARMESRHALGCEIDDSAFELCRKNLSESREQSMFPGFGSAKKDALIKQVDMWEATNE